MTTPKRILVPTDFSEPAEFALDHAMDLAESVGAEVRIVHFWEIPNYPFAESFAVTEDTVNAIENAGRAAMERLVARKQRKGVLLRGDVKLGDPRGGIEASAKEFGADLVCMGTHGRRGLGRALLGSVAEYTVRTSEVPVLTVRQRSEKRH